MLSKVAKALGPAGPFGRSLEVGAGTGYFSLNMLQAGFVGDAVCTDISPGMLDALQANARRLDLDVGTVACDAEELPFEDDVLRPRLRPRRAAPPARPRPRLRRVPPRAAPRRAAVLRGRAVALRRPHRPGPQARRVPRGAALAPAHARRARRPRATATAARPTTSSRPSSTSTPSPPTSSRRSPRRAGLADVRIRGEELLANWFGWANRALEATADPDTVPWGWKVYAFKGYLAFQEVDRRLLEPRLPPAIFYNLILSARNPS